MATANQAGDETATRSAYIDMRDVVIEIQGQTILHGVSVAIERGEHIAIVGTSGAGKSTLVSLLLGRHYATRGEVFVGGKRLDHELLQALRRNTAWIDPNMQLWERYDAS